MITFPQFVTTMAQKRRNSYEYVRETLEHLDPSGDGYIDCKNLRWDLANVGSVLPIDEINEVFDELDIGNDLIDCEGKYKNFKEKFGFTFFFFIALYRELDCRIIVS